MLLYIGNRPLGLALNVTNTNRCFYFVINNNKETNNHYGIYK